MAFKKKKRSIWAISGELSISISEHLLGIVVVIQPLSLDKQLLHTPMHIHAKSYRHTIMKSDTVLRKIYLSLYLKGLCVRASWRPNRTATYWPPHSICPQCFFPVLLGCTTGGPGAQLSAGCWLSLPHLVTNWSGLQNSIGGPEGPFCRVLFFSTAFSLQTQSEYALPPSLEWHVFDRHRAEITVTQFTGDPLPVDQFVTVTWDFNPVPYCQPSSPTPMEYTLPPSLGWHVWPGRRSVYNNTRNTII